MVSLGNSLPGNRSGAYFFEDNDSDDLSTSDVSPLLRRPTAQNTTNPHTHIVTGYLSAVEAIALIGYLCSLIGLTLAKHDNKGETDQNPEPDKLVAFFCMVHVAVWVMVGVFDRIIQWRHQSLRRKGYLKFYRKMRNIRRLPFIVVSLCNAIMLLFVCVLYIYQIDQHQGFHGLTPVYVLYIIVSCEALLVVPCLIYYIVQATIFNVARQPPDVIHDTFAGPQSPTTSVTAVGFRDGEDLDELLERQADMIRYLQQHNANLGRRILELQSQAME